MLRRILKLKMTPSHPYNNSHNGVYCFGTTVHCQASTSLPYENTTVTSQQPSEHTVSGDCLPQRAVSIPCVALTSTIRAYIIPYSHPRGQPLKIRQVSLALCWLSSMAWAAASLDPAGPTCPGKPHVLAQHRQLLPQAVCKNSQRGRLVRMQRCGTL